MATDINPRDFRLLVAEDDTSLRETVTECLTDEGYRVMPVSTGAEGLQLLQQSRVDLVLSDILMPNGDGFFLVEKIRHLDAAMPIIFMTGYHHHNEDQALDAGANALIKKPMGLDCLLSEIQRQLLSAYRSGSSAV